jgi:hypothetical protein
MTARSIAFRPPMPWYILREMTEQDLRAMYRFIRSVGPAGEQAPTYLPPNSRATGALYLVFRGFTIAARF